MGNASSKKIEQLEERLKGMEQLCLPADKQTAKPAQLVLIKESLEQLAEQIKGIEQLCADKQQTALESNTEAAGSTVANSTEEMAEPVGTEAVDQEKLILDDLRKKLEENDEKNKRMSEKIATLESELNRKKKTDAVLDELVNFKNREEKRMKIKEERREAARISSERRRIAQQTRRRRMEEEKERRMTRIRVDEEARYKAEIDTRDGVCEHK